MSGHVTAEPRLHHADKFRGRLPQSLLAEAAMGFVPPHWMKKAQEKSRSGIVLLAGGRGTGRRIAALNLLCREHGAAASIRHLDGDLDFGTWQPASGEANGYLVEGTLGGLIRNGAALTSIGARLLEAGAVMAVVLPDDPELTTQLDDLLDMAPIHCTPPDPQEVLQAKLALAVPENEDRRRLLGKLPSELLPELLPPGASPRDAVDVAKAIVTATGSAESAGARAAYIDVTLAEQADREIAELLPKWLDDPPAMNALLAAAVFAGSSPQTIAEQADRLATVSHAQEVVDTSITCQGGQRSLHALLCLAGVRTDTVQRPGRPPETRMFFARCQWPGAILRHIWHGPSADSLVSWLRGVEGHDLIERAGWALALSVPAKRGNGRLRRIQTCAMSGGPSGRAVAARALRILMNDSNLSQETAACLGSWAYDQRWPLRCVVAVTCGSDSGIAPLRPALALMRKVVRSADADPNHYVDQAVDDAILHLFRRGDRRVVLRELCDWTESEGAQAWYATRVLSKLLRSDLTWFGAQTADDEVFDMTVLLIRRTLRARGPVGALRDVMLRWQRAANWDPIQAEAVDALLFAVGADRHPHVRRFLNAIDRHR
ncbi:hypothetical protein GCM10022224_041830 [Nonomuraea antimicrobica]|uniref:HEAT repeat-containing protein n=2 Tax=Nonomuraea antimicrobica TaxID=561173 RepID=A0ABP7BXY9_9ACTN